MKKILVLVAALLGCEGSVSQQLEFETTTYKRDVKILFEGKEYLGVAVLPRRDRYTFEMTFPGALDLFTFRTCHREVTQEDAGGGRIFGKKNKVSMVYSPVAPLETDVCHVEIGGYEKGKGRHSWGYIDFETSFETLPAVVLCNGSREGFGGVSICQSLNGLITRIIFTKKVAVAYNKEKCSKPNSDDGMAFELLQSVGRCVYSFVTHGSPHEWHRFTTIGYQDILIRNID
jgi:hypothetical protein